MLIWPFFAEKVLISETVSARAKRTKLLDHPREKTNFAEKFNFWSLKKKNVLDGKIWSCDLEKL